MSNWMGITAVMVFSGFAPLALAQAPGAEKGIALEADRIDDDQVNNRIIAEGNVQASYQGRLLQADRLIYDLNTRKVRAIGNVAIIETDGTQRFADEVEVDENLRDGFAIGFSTRFEDGGLAVANSAVRRSDGINSVDQAIYTACKVCEDGSDSRPTWALRARRAILNENNDKISYRDAILEIAGVPVFYTPYFFHSDPTGERSSGLLQPRVSISQRLGFTWGQPYYQVIDRSSDITFTPFYYAQVNPRLGVELRKRFWSGSVEFDGSYTYERDFDTSNNLDPNTPETSRWNVYGRGLFQISRDWQWGFGVERTSDDDFARLYTVDGRNRRYGLYDSRPNINLSQIFLSGQGHSYYADVSLLTFQSEEAGVNDGTLPVATPFLFVETLQDWGRFGQSALTLSSATLSRTDGADSRRVSVGGEWSVQGILPGGFVVEPFAEARGDYYDLDELVSGEDDVTRGVGSVGGRLSWPLVNTAGGVDLIVEPKVMGAWGVANANNEPIPNEDSILFEYNETALFDANGFGNYDLYEGDGRLAAGLTATARLGQNTRLEFEGGRRWRTRADENFDRISNLDGTSSDWVAGIAARIGRNLNINTRIRLDPENYQVNRIDANANFRVGPLRARGRYFILDDEITENGEDDEGVDFAGAFTLTKNIELSYSQRFDLAANVNRLRTIGVAYVDDCSRFEFGYTKSGFSDGPIQPDERFEFRFILKNIGQIGSSSLNRQ
ncbi:MAG: LPS assembly protein LptD [Pseudomonadota bacterium]